MMQSMLLKRPKAAPEIPLNVIVENDEEEGIDSHRNKQSAED